MRTTATLRVFAPAPRRSSSRLSRRNGVLLFGILTFVWALPSFGWPILVDEDFSSDPFAGSWATNNPGDYHWDSASETLFTDNYTNSGDWATTPIAYGGETFRLEFDVMPAERDTGDVCIGLFDYTRTSHSGTAERLFVLLGGYNNQVYVEACDAGQDYFDSGAGNGLMVQDEWHHVLLQYDSPSRILDLEVTRGGSSVLSWQRVVDNGFSGSLEHLGVSMNGQWVTSGRHEVAYLDNMKMSIIPEPTSLALVGLGLAGVLTSRSRRRDRNGTR